MNTIKVEEYVLRMIKEHKELVTRIRALHAYIYSPASDKDDKIEFANKCIQLTAMKKYEEALRARIENAGIGYYDGNYVTKEILVDVNKEIVKDERAGDA